MQQKKDLPPPPSLDEMRTDAPLALFLDFDGTLVEIAATPAEITVPKGLATSLHELDRKLEGRLALVSGRAISDVENFMGKLAIACAGSHGIDRRLASGEPLDEEPVEFPAEARLALERFAIREGFSIENKPHGGALHFRQNPSLEEDGLAFAQELAGKHDLVVKRGKCVIELVHPGADKGGAVRAFMTRAPFAGSRPLFVGDDVTDEDGFAAVVRFGGQGIVVGDRVPTRAGYKLKDPVEVHRWLGL